MQKDLVLDVIELINAGAQSLADTGQAAAGIPARRLQISILQQESPSRKNFLEQLRDRKHTLSEVQFSEILAQLESFLT